MHQGLSLLPPIGRHLWICHRAVERGSGSESRLRRHNGNVKATLWYGKHTKNYWKLPFIVSFPIQNLWFSILVMLVYQRVSTNWVSRGGLQTDWTHSRDTVPNTHKMVLFLFAKSFGLPRLTLGLMLIITNLRLRGHQVVLGITYQKL
jgi:hypothetical protein